MSRIIDSPSRLKIDPAKPTYSRSHHPMVAHKRGCQLGNCRDLGS